MGSQKMGQNSAKQGVQDVGTIYSGAAPPYAGMHTSTDKQMEQGQPKFSENVQNVNVQNVNVQNVPKRKPAQNSKQDPLRCPQFTGNVSIDSIQEQPKH